jgi:hypothetical protein
MRAQWLADRPHATVAEVAAHMIGLQAQDTAAVRLAVRARSTGTAAEDVRRASADGSVVRTWLMRNTLHMVAATDVRWLLSIFGPRNRAGGARRRAELGLDETTLARALPALKEILARESPLSRADLVRRLADHGVLIDPRGQAPAHLVAYAAASGVLCRGPDLDRDEPGYVLLDEWVPPTTVPDPEEALVTLAGRYLHAYAPASLADFAAWSGLPMGTARHAFLLAESPPEPPFSGPQPAARLLGAFDNYLLAYRDVLDRRYAARIKPGGGIIHPAVIVDGQVVGRWWLRRDRHLVEVDLFDADRVAFEPPLAAEAADVGRFLSTELRLAGPASG